MARKGENIYKSEGRRWKGAAGPGGCPAERQDIFPFMGSLTERLRKNFL